MCCPVTRILAACTLVLWTLTGRAIALDVTAVPVGCPIPHTIANDTDSVTFYTPCPPTVFDANGVPISFFACPQIAVELAPGATVTTYWPQTDANGQQVPEGLYFVEGVAYQITSTVDTALFPLGSPRVGETRAFSLCAPAHPNGLYLMAASGSSNLGVPLPCGVLFPLDFDNLVLQSLTNPNTFQSFVGQLDAQGRTADPRIAVAHDPALAGVSFVVAFAVLDPLAACPAVAVSDPEFLTVVP